MNHTHTNCSTVRMSIVETVFNVVSFHLPLTTCWDASQNCDVIGISGTATVVLKCLNGIQCLICLKVFKYPMKAHGSGCTFFIVNNSWYTKMSVIWSCALMRLKIASHYLKRSIEWRLIESARETCSGAIAHRMAWPYRQNEFVCLFVHLEIWF